MFATGYHRLTVWLKHVQSLVICWTKVPLINKAESNCWRPVTRTLNTQLSSVTCEKGYMFILWKTDGEEQNARKQGGKVSKKFCPPPPPQKKKKKLTSYVKICQFLSRFGSCRAPIKIVICLLVCMKLSHEMLKGFPWNFMLDNSDKILNWFQF
jgi:hypothetical protein